MSSFSMNGSPTCTLGRLRGPPSSNVSDARIDAPPMPSPPVLAPNRMTRLPAPDALASLMSSCRITPTHSALTSGLPEVRRVEDELAADVGQAQAVAVAADAGHHPGRTRRVSAASAGPKRSGSITAIGRAPIEMMSRTMPPTPVAAPW